MNATYNYKSGKNNMHFVASTSKKGTCRPFVRKRPAYMDFSERCLSFIDMIIELFSSARVMLKAKALFGFIALMGLLSIIGGIEFGKISLIAGLSCLAVLVALEFLVLRDDNI